MLMLVLLLISSVQNIVLGATTISEAKIIRGESIKTNVEYSKRITML